MRQFVVMLAMSLELCGVPNGALDGSADAPSANVATLPDGGPLPAGTSEAPPGGVTIAIEGLPIGTQASARVSNPGNYYSIRFSAADGAQYECRFGSGDIQPLRTEGLNLVLPINRGVLRLERTRPDGQAVDRVWTERQADMEGELSIIARFDPTAMHFNVTINGALCGPDFESGRRGCVHVNNVSGTY